MYSFAEVAFNLFVVTSRNDAYPSPFELTFAGFALVFQGLSLVSASAWVVIFAYAASALFFVIGTQRGLRSRLIWIRLYGAILPGGVAHLRFAESRNLFHGRRWRPSADGGDKKD